MPVSRTGRSWKAGEDEVKQFNTTAICVPEINYMVDISDKLAQIKVMVDKGDYFTINRARQYGKTTMLTALTKYLASEYLVVYFDFQDVGNAVFESEGAFTKGLSRLFMDAAEFQEVPIPSIYLDALGKLNALDEAEVKMDELFRIIRRWCRDSVKPIVLIIDEVDSVTNNQVFLDFLAQLRSLYIKKRADRRIKSFQSVILACVTDIKHLRAKIRPEDAHRENSPWNIAADFNIDMSLSENGICNMLEEYEEDHHACMDTQRIAQLIHDYTEGYPFLVSRICQLIDEIVVPAMGKFDAWTQQGLEEAVKLLLAESNTLFQSITKNLNNYPDLKASIRNILMEGAKVAYNPDQEDIAQMQMYGLIRNEHNTVRIANRIFETRLYNLFLSDEEMKNNVFSREGSLAKNVFVRDGRLNMRLILERFAVTFTQVFGPLEEKFKEKDGREYFLLYLKPIINGVGNYYIEAQTRDETRTDVIVDYLGQQYIVELKIWRGDRYNKDGEKQILSYLEHWDLHTGYMLSFNFNKKKEPGIRRVALGDRVLFEATV